MVEKKRKVLYLVRGSRLFFSCFAFLLLSFPACAAELVTALPATRSVELRAFTRAKASIELIAESQGKVLEVLAEVGDQIGEEGVFARLDPTFIELERATNEAMQKKLVAQLAYNTKEVTRYRRLVAGKSAPQSQLDALTLSLSNSKYELESLKTEGEVLRERLLRTAVRVPAGWKIISRAVEPGQWVNVGQVLGQAGDFQTLLVPFALTAQQYKALREKEHLELFIEDEKQVVPASIEFVSPGFDAQTRKIGVTLCISRGLEEFRGGLQCSLKIETQGASGSVILPRKSLEQRYEQYWVKREDGQSIQVTFLGLADESSPDMVRIASDTIQPGQRFYLLDSN